MNVRRLAAGVGILLVAGAARAQTGHATWTWQVSADAGMTWREGRVEVFTTQPSVLVRCWIDWEDDQLSAYAFAAAQFDAVVDHAGAADFVRALTRPYPMDHGSNQTLVVTRYADLIKIDDSRDTLGPGVGTRGIHSGQLVEVHSEGNFTTARPLSIFEYELVLDGTPGSRVISDLYTRSPSGCIERAVRVYLSPSGTATSYTVDPCVGRRDVEWAPAELVVVACAADFNADRQVDFFDYLDFAAAFAGGDTSADFNGDNQVDFMDYLDFVTAYDAGCA
jgi:hypothetical protein